MIIIIYLLICIGLIAIGVPAVGVLFVFALLVFETLKQRCGGSSGGEGRSRKEIWEEENEDDDEYEDLGY